MQIDLLSCGSREHADYSIYYGSMCDYLQSVPKCAVSVVYNAPCEQSLAVRNGERLSYKLTRLHGVIFLDRRFAFLLVSFYY